MKRVFLIIFINIVVFFVLLFCSEAFFYNKIISFIKSINASSNKDFEAVPYFQKLISFDDDYEKRKKDSFRKPEGLFYRKKPVIIFGCSFAYGGGLLSKQSFGYKLSHLSRRPVYNRAYMAWGLQHMLYQVRRNDFYKEVREPQYVIYVIIDDQMRRMYLDIFDPFCKQFYLKYEEKNGQLERVKPLFPFLWNLYTVKQFQMQKAASIVNNEKNRDKVFSFMKEIFVSSKKELETKYPNEKFIILKYKDNDDSWYLTTPRWKELEKEGFIVTDTNELTGQKLSLQKYKIPDGHPNEKAWNIITPALIKKYKL